MHHPKISPRTAFGNLCNSGSDGGENECPFSASFKQTMLLKEETPFVNTYGNTKYGAPEASKSSKEPLPYYYREREGSFSSASSCSTIFPGSNSPGISPPLSPREAKGRLGYLDQHQQEPMQDATMEAQVCESLPRTSFASSSPASLLFFEQHKLARHQRRGSLRQCPFDIRCVFDGKCSFHEHLTGVHGLAVTELDEENSFSAEIVVNLEDRTRRAAVVVVTPSGNHLLWTLESTRRADGELQYGLVVTKLDSLDQLLVSVSVYGETESLSWSGPACGLSLDSHSNQLLKGNGLVVLHPTNASVFRPGDEDISTSQTLWFVTKITMEEVETPPTARAMQYHGGAFESVFVR